MDLKDITIREPKISDLRQALKYVNKLSKEKTYIRFQGQVITEKEEKDWIKSIIQKIKNKKTVCLLAFDNKTLIGVSEISLSFGATEHIGNFGISIDKKYRGNGIGNLLMDSILAEAKNKLKKLKIIKLEAFGDNEIALSLYRKKGFIKFGEMPKGNKRKGKYSGDVYMYKNIR